MNKAFSTIMLILFLAGMLIGIIQIRTVKADGPSIYINADGSITPPTAPISTEDKITYVLTGNIINESIVVQRNNIVLDGQGYIVQGVGPSNPMADYGYDGIILTSTENVMIKNTNIAGFTYGVWVFSSSGDTVCSNNLTDNNCGIRLGQNSGVCTVCGNSITDNIGGGVDVGFSSGGTVYGNSITADNGNAVEIDSSTGCDVYGNNLTTCGTYGVMLDYSSMNSIDENTITANKAGGVWLYASSNNTVWGNNVETNVAGIILWNSSDNEFYHNSFVNNDQQVRLTTSEPNSWNNSYPIGGNYWSDYQTRYPNAVEIDSSGIWNTPYVIDENNTDQYPLMHPLTGATPTSTRITFSGNPVSAGSPVMCTAIVYGSNPTGAVTWSTSSSTGDFSNSVSTLFSGSCSTVYTDTSPGIVTITASYSGDPNNAPSSSNTTLTVSPSNQYLIIFDQSGANSAFTGTVVTIDGENYALDDLPRAFLWLQGSTHTFSFTSRLVVDSTTCEWTSTSGLSPLQAGTLTIEGPGKIIGNYVLLQSTPVVPPWLILVSIMGLGLVGASSALLMFLAVIGDTRKHKRKRPRLKIMEKSNSPK